MSLYNRLPVQVEAIEFNGQRVDALPQWARDHSAVTAMGEQVIGKDAVGQLLVPVSSGTIETCRFGDYLVFNGAGVAVVKKAVFEAEYAPAEVTETIVADAEPAVGNEPAPAAEPPKKGKATGAEPASDAAIEAEV